MRVMLVILDGWGWSPIALGNPLLSTPTPGLDTLLARGRHALLRTASLEIGLPWGSVGDSELGHYNLGTGRIVLRRGVRKPELVALTKRPANRSDEPLGRPLARTASLKTPVSLGSSLAAAGLAQAKLGDASKREALTVAMNGYPSTPIDGETFLAIPDETDLPRWLADQSALVDHDLAVVNLSLVDRAAHAGDLPGVRRAIVTTDTNLQALARRCAADNAVLYLAADHGNIEQTTDAFDRPDAEHTTNPILLLRLDFSRRQEPLAWATHPRVKAHVATETPIGLLADVAPTILDDFGLPQPEKMVGISLRSHLLAR